jgi:hypothetical protein
MYSNRIKLSSSFIRGITNINYMLAQIYNHRIKLQIPDVNDNEFSMKSSETLIIHICLFKPLQHHRIEIRPDLE